MLDTRGATALTLGGLLMRRERTRTMISVEISREEEKGRIC